MSMDRPDFEVLSAAQVRRRYRLEGIRAEEVEFAEADVPDTLKHLIPLARVWGIGDDVLRSDMIDASDPQALNELQKAVAEVEDELEKWLTSKEALAAPTPAYFAFANLVIVADEIEAASP